MLVDHIKFTGICRKILKIKINKNEKNRAIVNIG